MLNKSGRSRNRGGVIEGLLREALFTLCSLGLQCMRTGSAVNSSVAISLYSAVNVTTLLNHYASAKSPITWNEIKSKSLEPKSPIKSNHDVSQMTTVADSIVYARNVINVHLAGLSMSSVSCITTLHIFAKIRDGAITEINGPTQLQ